jgi:hypothetical protein
VTKIAGSGSDPDPPQNVMDPEHWLQGWEGYWKTVNGVGSTGSNEKGSGRDRRMREVLDRISWYWKKILL